MAQHGKRYSGDLYGRVYGSNGGFAKMGNVSALTTSRESETDELKSTGRDDYGEAIDSVVTPGVTEISISFNSFDKEGLARALMGKAVALDTQPQTLSDIALTVEFGAWIDIGSQDLDGGSITLTDSHSSPIDKSTYTLNPRLGMLMFNSSSGLQSGEKITLNGKTRGRAGFVIDANALQSMPMELKLDGKDRITNKDGVLWIPHTVLTSDADIDWMSNDWWQNGLSGKLIKDSDKPTMRFTEYD